MSQYILYQLMFLPVFKEGKDMCMVKTSVKIKGGEFSTSEKR